MTFTSVALVILNLFRESVEYNLATLLPELATKPVTNAAFSVARYKIKIDFFLELNQMLCEHIESLKPKLWKGFRLIAGDGTSISLPPSPQIKKHFGVFTISTGNTHTCLANACMFYDVFSNLVVDVIMAPVSIGENTLMYTMIDKAQFSNSIILLDRGFGYMSTCKKILNKQLDFCIRLKSTQSVFANNVMSSPFSDFITEWMPSDQESSSCKKNGLDPGPIKVRVTKVILNTGEIELLVSSILDLTTVNESDMRQLYELRWAVEEGFKKLKPKMKLEQFGCRRYEGVYQEFYAHIFMLNLVTIIGNQMEEKISKKTKNRKLTYKYNWQNAFRFVRNKFIEIFHLEELQKSLDSIFEQISDSLVAIKHGRTFERQKGGRRKSRYAQCYK